MNPIPLPWLLVIGVVALAATSAYSVHAGRKYESAQWQAKYDKREAGLLRAAGAANARVRELEQAAAAQLAEIDAAYQRGQSDAKAKTERTVADLRAGTLRLRRDLAASACAAGTAGAAAPASGSDDQAPAELWRASAENLVRVADDADEVARQLGSCQAVIESYQQHFGRRANDGRQ